MHQPDFLTLLCLGKFTATCIFQTQSRIGQQATPDNDTCQTGKTLANTTNISNRQQVAIIEKRLLTPFVKRTESLHIHLSLILLLAKPRMQDKVRQRQTVEQRQQSQAFIRLLPSQSQLDRQTHLGKLLTERSQQVFHLLGIGQHPRPVVSFSQQGERTTQVQVCLAIASRYKQFENPLRLL